MVFITERESERKKCGVRDSPPLADALRRRSIKKERKDSILRNMSKLAQNQIPFIGEFAAQTGNAREKKYTRAPEENRTPIQHDQSLLFFVQLDHKS
jgi:hypothetical protein